MEKALGSSRLVAWDYVVIGVVLLASVLIGFYHALVQRRKSGVSEFLMAGRSMGSLPVALSMLATYISAIAMLGAPVETYFYGTQQWLFAVSYLVVIPVSAHCLLPVFYEAKVTSAYEYLELRFSPVIRKAASSVHLIEIILHTVVVLYAPSLSLSVVTGSSMWTSILIIGGTCIAYTAVGGMRAVLWTDTFQIVVMFISLTAIVTKGCIDMGGIQQVWKTAQMGQRTQFFDFDFDPTLRQSFWSVTIGGTFTWLCSYGVNQSMVQRYLTTKNLKVAQRALWWNLPGLLVIVSLLSLTGLMIFARYVTCDPLELGIISAKDQIVPLFVMDVFQSLPGFPGLFVASIACATLSTMSSNLNGLTAMTLEDFIKPNVKALSEKQATLLVKLIPVAYGCLVIALVAVADRFGSVTQATITIAGMIGGPLLGIFFLGMFAPWANTKGALAGLLTGYGVAASIGIGSQLSAISWPTLPTESDECPWLNGSWSTTAASIETATPINTTAKVIVPSEIINSGFPLFQISFLWYSAVCSFVVFLVGSAVSYFTKGHSPDDVNPALISPAVRWSLNRQRTGGASVSNYQVYTTEKTNHFQIQEKAEQKNGLARSVESETLI